MIDMNPGSTQFVGASQFTLRPPRKKRRPYQSPGVALSFMPHDWLVLL